MLKIKPIADIHLEFNKGFKLNVEGVDVLVDAGDTSEGIKCIDWYKDLLNSNPDLNIVFVSGNHSFYGENIDCLPLVLKELSKEHPRLHYLENESVVIKGYRFIGACLWTDFNKYNERAMREAKYCMNDFRHIKCGNLGALFTPKQAYAKHINSKDYIFNELKQSEEPCIVITHHAPVLLDSMDLLSHAYCSDLREDLQEFCPIVWFHGHTHKSTDRVVQLANDKQFRLVCNCLGYPMEGYKTGFDTDKIIEVDKCLKV